MHNPVEFWQENWVIEIETRRKEEQTKNFAKKHPLAFCIQVDWKNFKFNYFETEFLWGHQRNSSDLNKRSDIKVGRWYCRRGRERFGHKKSNRVALTIEQVYWYFNVWIIDAFFVAIKMSITVRYFCMFSRASSHADKSRSRGTNIQATKDSNTAKSHASLDFYHVELEIRVAHIPYRNPIHHTYLWIFRKTSEKNLVSVT